MEKLAAVSPFSTRPMNSQARLGAKAMNMKSTARPNSEISSTGRRPIRSLSIPRTGPQNSCMMPQTHPKTTFHRAASAVSPPVKLLIRLGSTGIMIPNDTAFIRAQTKTKLKAALRPPAVGVASLMTFVSPAQSETKPERVQPC